MNRVALAAMATIAIGCSSSSGTGYGNSGGAGSGPEPTGGYATTVLSNSTQAVAAGGTTSGPWVTGGITSVATVCTPGVTQECLGAGRCAGAQACASDGLTWGPCDCGSGAGGAPTTGGNAGLGGASITGGSVATGGLRSFVMPTGGAFWTGGAFSAGGLSLLQTTEWTLTAPCTAGTLNCQCNSSGFCASGLTCNASKVCVSSAASGGAPSTGGATSVGGVPTTGGTRSTGGASNAGGQSNRDLCAGLTPPTSTGMLTVVSGYVTVGTLKGYAATYIGDKSNADTCITPRCSGTGCSPAFGSSALCAAGVVAADENYNSLAGISFNLNQSQTGSSPGWIAAQKFLRVIVEVGSGSDKALRIQLVTDTGATYCVDAGKWNSEQAIPMTAFSSRCWDVTDTDPLPADSKLTSIDLVVFSDSLEDHPFSVCLTGVDFE